MPYIKNRCAYCEREIGICYPNSNHPLKSTKDHIVPLSRGGRRVFKDNIAIVCHKCNGFKANFSPAEFIKILETRIENGSCFRGYTIDQMKLILINFSNILDKINIAECVMTGKKITPRKPPTPPASIDSLPKLTHEQLIRRLRMEPEGDFHIKEYA